MNDFEHLENAPITEALFDIKVKLPPGTELSSLDDAKRALETDYPQIDIRHSVQGRIEFGPGAEVTQTASTPTPHAYLMKSSDDANVVQLRVDGFAFSRLKPYTSWDEIFPTFLDLWRYYCAHAEVEIVTRLAVRYINHLRVPLPIQNIRDVLQAPPLVPRGVPQNMSAFLQRSVLHDPASGQSVNLIQATEESVDEKYATFLLDIDAYQHVELDQNSGEITSIFDGLRALKNKAFFNSITEQTRELFR